MKIFQRWRARTNMSHTSTTIDPTEGLTQDYTEVFFKRGLAGSQRSAEKIVPELIRLVSPKSVIDVGCGVGAWARTFIQNGVEDVLGVDGEHISRGTLLLDESRFQPADLFQPLKIGRNFDLALTVEVAEHLPETRAKSFVADLVQLAPVVAFSAAIPAQGGTNHINEHWPDYWAQIFAELDYLPVDCLRPRFWDDPEIEFWYKQNLILFVRHDHIDRYPELKAAERIPRTLRLVHPALFERTEHALNLSSGYSDLDAKTLGTIHAVSAFTRTPPARTFALCQAIRHIVKTRVIGDIVECGVWRGGGAMTIARTLLEEDEAQRELWLYDLFGGMVFPAQKDVDFRGNGAMRLVERIDKLAGEIWSDTSEDDVKTLMHGVGYPSDKIHYVKGKVEETIPEICTGKDRASAA